MISSRPAAAGSPPAAAPASSCRRRAGRRAARCARPPPRSRARAWRAPAPARQRSRARRWPPPWRGGPRRSRRRGTTEQRHGVAQGGGRQHAQAIDRRRLAVVVMRDEQGGDATPPAREPDGQRAAHGPDLSVERELADDSERAQRALAERAGGRQDAERDRKVERRAFLAEIGRSEVHRDAIGRKGEPRVADRRPHALATLADGRVGQAHRRECRQSRATSTSTRTRAASTPRSAAERTGASTRRLFEGAAARQCPQYDTRRRAPCRSGRPYPVVVQSLAHGQRGPRLDTDPPSGVRPVVLVVDDEPGVRESFRLILEDDYEVIDVPDGRPPRRRPRLPRRSRPARHPAAGHGRHRGARADQGDSTRRWRSSW